MDVKSPPSILLVTMGLTIPNYAVHARVMNNAASLPCLGEAKARSSSTTIENGPLTFI